MRNKIIYLLGSLGLLVGMFAFTSSADAATLTRQLSLGMSGSDVSSLQTFLAQDTSVYPQGLVTGYFGTLTQSAVSKFQAKNGLSVVGRVGPLTLAAINAQMNGGGTVSGADIIAPTISNISVNVGTNSNQTTTTSTTTATTTDTTATSTTATTTTNTVVPYQGSGTATIHWNTNEQATGKVYYSTAPLSMTESTNDVAIGGSVASTDTYLHTTQDVVLTGLQPQTTYYYVIYAKDSAGNLQMTWPTTFKTQ